MPKKICNFIIALILMTTGFLAQAVPIIQVSEIKPGMKGYGLTVFQGTKPERFDVEVISVIPNFFVKKDIILIRCNHPVTDQSGVIGGMSGSPIFLDGRLAGALAYGWSFSKEPIAGVTPISAMMDVLKRKPKMKTNFFKRKGTVIALGEKFENEAGLPKIKDESGYFEAFAKNAGTSIIPARTPLTLAGFSSSVQKMLSEALEIFEIEPMMGGGASSSKEDPITFENGSAIGVQLIRGDMAATGIGTVTLVDGKNVLAFGHPMFNLGEGYFPVTTARIHTVISSLARSNKLGSPISPAGSLVQDRTSCIAARTDKKADMVPVSIVVSDPQNKQTDSYKVEVISHRLLTPRFVKAVIANVINDAASDVNDVTAEIKGAIKISGRPGISVFDAGVSRMGAGGVAFSSRPVSIIEGILGNPFEPVSIESMKFEITLRYGLEVALLSGAYITAENPKPGEKINVYVRLMKFDDEEQIITVPITIPVSAAGKTLDVEVSGGDFTRPIMAEPINLDEALDNVQRLYPSKSLVIKLNAAEEGVTMHGRILDQLPPSVVNTLRPTSGFDRFDQYKTESVRITETPYLIEGKQSFKITVANRRPQ